MLEKNSLIKKYYISKNNLKKNLMPYTYARNNIEKILLIYIKYELKFKKIDHTKMIFFYILMIDFSFLIKSL